MIGVIDYGAGNLRSVKKALDHLGADSTILRQPDDFSGVTRLVLPGVGSFEAAMNKMHDSMLYQPTAAWLQQGKPFLGICLGMQMLFEQSDESPGVPGFGIFPGRVKRFQAQKVPQIGWNTVRNCAASPLLAGLPEAAYFYFLHGFYVQPEDATLITGETNYSIRYAAMVERGQIHAVQFHPEKSADNGQQLLRNWIALYR